MKKEIEYQTSGKGGTTLRNSLISKQIVKKDFILFSL